MKGWDNSHIERLKARGMVVDHTSPLPKNRNIVIESPVVSQKIKRPATVPRQEPGQLREMKLLLKFMKIDFVTEYAFLKDRRFRFDIYFEVNDKKIGVEYDGIFSERSRHTSLTGFSNDTEKTNLAAINGFIVLRYTAMTYKNFINHLNYLLKK